MKRIQFVGLATVLTGVFTLAQHPVESFSAPMRWMLQGEVVPGFHPLYMVLLFVFIPILPIAKIGAGIGLLRRKNWAWSVTFVALMLDFMYRLVGHINIWTLSWRYPNLVAQSGSMPEGTVCTESYSMWPTTVITLISLLSWVVLLSQKPPQKTLAQPSGEAHDEPRRIADDS